MKKISVVIPTYKRPELLLVCLRHLEMQSVPKADFEVLVVSDGHDGDTENALAALRQQTDMEIHYHHTPGKQGPATARNIGWRHARAPLVAFTDDDCQPSRHWLASYLQRYNGQPRIVFSGFTHVPLPPNPSDFALNTFHLQTADFITANCACTKQALEEVDGFDERFKAAWREDSDLQFRFLDAGIPLVKNAEAIVVHPVREDVPWNVSIQEQKKGIYDALLFKKFPKKYRNEIQPNSVWSYYAIVLSTFLLILSLLFGWKPWLSIVFFAVALLLTLRLFYRRIKPLRKTPQHIWAMFVTSLALPFVSTYWRLYGAFKFRVFFI